MCGKFLKTDYGFAVDVVTIREQFSLWGRSHSSCCSVLASLQPGEVVVKLVFRNAFNSIRRDKMFAAIDQLAHKIRLFVHSAYKLFTSLFFGKVFIQSAEGVHEGDPLGSLLFCLSTLSHVSTGVRVSSILFG